MAVAVQSKQLTPKGPGTTYSTRNSASSAGCGTRVAGLKGTRKRCLCSRTSNPRSRRARRRPGPDYLRIACIEKEQPLRRNVFRASRELIPALPAHHSDREYRRATNRRCVERKPNKTPWRKKRSRPRHEPQGILSHTTLCIPCLPSREVYDQNHETLEAIRTTVPPPDPVITHPHGRLFLALPSDPTRIPCTAGRPRNANQHSSSPHHGDLHAPYSNHGHLHTTPSSSKTYRNPCPSCYNDANSDDQPGGST
jgi:hypothetical protein